MATRIWFGVLSAFFLAALLFSLNLGTILAFFSASFDLLVVREFVAVGWLLVGVFGFGTSAWLIVRHGRVTTRVAVDAAQAVAEAA